MATGLHLHRDVAFGARTAQAQAVRELAAEREQRNADGKVGRLAEHLRNAVLEIEVEDERRQPENAVEERRENVRAKKKFDGEPF